MGQEDCKEWEQEETGKGETMADPETQDPQPEGKNRNWPERSDKEDQTYKGVESQTQVDRGPERDR